MNNYNMYKIQAAEEQDKGLLNGDCSTAGDPEADPVLQHDPNPVASSA